MPPPPPKRGRGRPKVYSDRLFLKALVIMIVRHLHRVHELLTVLEQPTPEMQTLRALLTENGRYPTRRTWERRLKAIPSTLPAQIGCLGRALVALIQPWARCGRAAAIDSTVLSANGGVWHNQHREQGIVPHTSIDTEAHWTKSGWHGWVYGWKLHVVSVVAGVWIPLAADLTPANTADNEAAPALIQELPKELRFLLGAATTMRQAYGPHVTSGITCWLPVSMVGILTPIPVLRSDASFTNCVRWQSRTSMSISRASLTGTGKCRPRVLSTPVASRLAPSLSISWPCSIGSNMASNSMLASMPS
jgi:hypothetical protein